MKVVSKKVWVGFWILYSFCLFALNELSGFKLLQVPTMNPSFADLRLITSSSDCFSEGNWSMTSASCDPWGRPFNYPSIWVKLFAWFGIGESKTVFLGSLEFFILGASLVYWVKWAYLRLSQGSSKQTYAILVFLILFSPPILLLAERANTDILVFAGTTLAHHLLSKDAYLSAGLLISFLGMLKLYPYFALLQFLDFKNQKSKSFFIWSFSIGGLFLISEDLDLIASRSVNGWNSISYGVSEIPSLLLKDAYEPYNKIIASILGLSILVVLSTFFSFFVRHRFSPIEYLKVSNFFVRETSSLMNLLFLASCLAGTSYDYRLVTLVPFLFALFVSVKSANSARLVTFSALISLYFGHLTYHFGNFGLLLNICGDVTIVLLASLLVSFYITQIHRRVVFRKQSDV